MQLEPPAAPWLGAVPSPDPRLGVTDRQRPLLPHEPVLGDGPLPFPALPGLPVAVTAPPLPLGRETQRALSLPSSPQPSAAQKRPLGRRLGAAPWGRAGCGRGRQAQNPFSAGRADQLMGKVAAYEAIGYLVSFRHRL